MDDSLGTDSCCEEASRLRASRRGFLAGSSAVVGGIVATSVFGGAFREVAFAADAGDTVVILNLGGGVDGLSWVVPYSDPQYYLARPSLGVPQSQLLATDGTFGLNPNMAALMPLWNQGKVGMLHATGLSSPNRSHFDAAEAIGDADPGSTDRRGWVNRMIGLTGVTNQFAAVGLSAGVPSSMVSGTAGTALTTMTGLDDVTVPGTTSSDAAANSRRLAQINLAWGSSASPMPVAVRSAVAASAALRQLPQNTLAASTAAYPSSDLGRTLQDTARMIKGGLGIRAVAVDTGAFDHHIDLGPITGSFGKQLKDVAQSVAAFFTDLGDRGSRVTLVTTSEFGRRLSENSSAGLDHGWGNVMMAVGANVAGGYHTAWPGLGRDDLTSGDLTATTDYRYLLSEIVAKRIPEVSVASVFPQLPSRRATGMIR